MLWMLLVPVVILAVTVVSVRSYRAGEVWHVIERPEVPRTQYGHHGEPTGMLEVAVDRRHADKVMSVGVCDFDDVEGRAELVAKAEDRAAHLNRVRNST